MVDDSACCLTVGHSLPQGHAFRRHVSHVLLFDPTWRPLLRTAGVASSCITAGASRPTSPAVRERAEEVSRIPRKGTRATTHLISLPAASWSSSPATAPPPISLHRLELIVSAPGRNQIGDRCRSVHWDPTGPTLNSRSLKHACAARLGRRHQIADFGVSNWSPKFMFTEWARVLETTYAKNTMGGILACLRNVRTA